MKVEKTLRLGGAKMAKSNKTERTEELIAGYQEQNVSRMCYSVVTHCFSVIQRQKLTTNSLSKPKQKVWCVR